MDEVSQVTDERQSILFDQLIERYGFQPKHLIDLLGVSRSRAYRIVEGESPFTFHAAHDLLRLHPDMRIGLHLAEAFVHLSPLRMVTLDESIDEPTDEAMADVLEQCAAFYRMRAESKADGVLDQSEQEQQAATIKRAMRMLHAALASLMSERVALNLSKLNGRGVAGRVGK